MSRVKNSQPILLILGSGPAAGRSASLVLERREGITPVFCVYAGDVATETKIETFVVDREQEVAQITQALRGRKLAGVLNRFDSYIPLHGMIVDAFALRGPGYEAVMKFKDKVEMDRWMKQLGLEKYRPATHTVVLPELEEALQEKAFPYVLKPYMGAKSRGVFVVRNEADKRMAMRYLEEHFASRKLFRSQISEHKVMVEEYVWGKQITLTGYVDEEGKLTVVGFEDVMAGKDVGQKHQQLVFRSVPSQGPKPVKQEMTTLLQQLVTASGLRSTFVFPDFIYSEKGLKLIELNVRIGGFRSDLYRYAFGMDLDLMAVEVALGEQPILRSAKQGSATAVEVWEDNSFQVGRVRMPNDPSIHEKKVFFQKGDKYIAPPLANEPLARFFVVDPKGSSLTRAQELRDAVEVEVG